MAKHTIFKVYMEHSLLFIASTFITLMFFLSGFHKVYDFTTVSKGLMMKTSLPLTLAQFVIGLVIVLEIVAPLVITTYTYQSSNKGLYMYAKLSTLALLLFTIVATLLYHFPPTGSNYYSFMSNLSTVGGLILLYNIL
jgi:uncharacterized membrane protein YphA (DoxX/SURF4 family)